MSNIHTEILSDLTKDDKDLKTASEVYKEMVPRRVFCFDRSGVFVINHG